jgi:hypothetical protein
MWSRLSESIHPTLNIHVPIKCNFQTIQNEEENQRNLKIIPPTSGIKLQFLKTIDLQLTGVHETKLKLAYM